jgi:hypothetical protein
MVLEPGKPISKLIQRIAHESLALLMASSRSRKRTKSSKVKVKEVMGKRAIAPAPPPGRAHRRAPSGAIGDLGAACL